MSNTQVTQYQALLLNQLHIWFHKTSVLNPANHLLNDDPADPLNDYLEVSDMIQSVSPALTDGPLLFTDGSSFFQDGIR